MFDTVSFQNATRNTNSIKNPACWRFFLIYSEVLLKAFKFGLKHLLHVSRHYSCQLNIAYNSSRIQLEVKTAVTIIMLYSIM